MSCTELHTGKFRIVAQTTEDTFNFIAKNLSKYWKPEITSRGYVNVDATDKYLDDYWQANKDFPYKKLNIGNQSYLIEMLEHKEFGEDEYPLEVSKNEDGTFDFIAQFYNGGTCLEECLEEELENLQSKTKSE
jgi:hypothetical protein